MSNRFRTNSLLLSGIDITSIFYNTGLQCYNTTIGGDTNLSGSLQSSGQLLYNNLIGFSGQANINYATTLNLTNTGVALVNRDNLVSGYFESRPSFSIPFNVASVTWSTMPNAQTFFGGTNFPITYLDLTRFTGVNLSVNKLATAGASTGILYLGYSATYSQTPSAYSFLDTNNTKANIGFANVFINSGWQPIANTAKSGVYVTLIGSGGNSVLSPIFGMINANFM